MIFAICIWILGMLSLVPYSVFILVTKGMHPDTLIYAVLPLFWLFGYWSVAGPLVSIWKIRRIVSTLEIMKTNDHLVDLMQSGASEEEIVSFLVRENKIPKFAARHFHRYLLEKFQILQQENRD